MEMAVRWCWHNEHWEQSLSTQHGEVLGTGHTPAPLQLGYEEMGGWVSTVFGQPPARLCHV
jgi:hypothetical protein